ncbi:hypothetical protein [Spongiactinospora sp. TRM90649]|uniref:hypothetical protein n=1 Tax=Spongiactinospora sp. TRM90649 TaxID=3031114 RepID=UPI0023FA2253|nr:hypothetical protein [Spongiactinospora sp. TRM90649]MDF5751237.1 hypothetical protein [Spongiactinospora sp. TRM90649]
MRIAKSSILGIAALVWGASLPAAPPAQAHDQVQPAYSTVSSVDSNKAAHRKISYKRRSGCTWLFYSSHSGAHTRKVQGGCGSHSWTYVQSNRGWKSGWKNGRTQAGAVVPRGHKVKYSWHKTQRNETAHLITHGT